MPYHRIGKNGKKYWGKKGAGIFFTDGEKTLLLKRSDKGDNGGTWGIPGGKAEAGETSIGTAMRESKEECGVVKGTRFDSLDSLDKHHQWTTFFFKINKPFECKLSDEHTDWKWVPLESLRDLDLHPKLKENLNRYKKTVKKNFSNVKALSFKEWMSLHKI